MNDKYYMTGLVGGPLLVGGLGPGPPGPPLNPALVIGSRSILPIPMILSDVNDRLDAIGQMLLSDLR